MTRTLPTVAVAGRQNVGKSTLANRLVGRRVAISDDAPGVTRDRLELEVAWNGRRFRLVDTAGYLHGARSIEALAGEQAERAMREADVVLLVVDGRAGVTEDDARLARALRTSPVPVVLVVNKTDSSNDVADASAFHALGLGEPLDVSALHGRNVGDLLDRLVELLPEGPSHDDEPSEPSFAIVGRPNVGKSSLFNRLVRDERAVVSEIPGTTRDSVDSLVDWPGVGPVRFVDTAGLRRGAKVTGIEYYSFLRATEAIERADVVVLVLDATAGLTGEDKRIASRVVEAGRGLLVVANKWDLVEEDKDDLFHVLGETVRSFARATMIRTSALTGRGIDRLPPILLDLHERWTRRASTSTVNDIVHQAQRERPPPRSSGTLHYATQATAKPPTFVVFGGSKAPNPSYQRYLENRLRATLDLDGVPIRLRFRPRSGRRGRDR